MTTYGFSQLVEESVLTVSPINWSPMRFIIKQTANAFPKPAAIALTRRRKSPLSNYSIYTFFHLRDDHACFLSDEWLTDCRRSQQGSTQWLIIDDHHFTNYAFPIYSDNLLNLRWNNHLVWWLLRFFMPPLDLGLILVFVVKIAFKFLYY